jgi:hypothetical protein
MYRGFHWAIPSYLDIVLYVWFLHFDNLQVEIFLDPNNLHLEMKGYTKMWKNVPLDLGFLIGWIGWKCSFLKII